MSSRREGREIPKNSIIITDLEAFVPEKVLNNEQLYDELKDTEYGKKLRRDGKTKNLESPEDIRRKVKIDERHIAAEDESSTDLAEEAGKKILEKSPLNPNESTLVLVGTLTAENRTPSVASELMFRLDITEDHGFDEFSMSGHDVGAACTSWIYGLYDAKAALVEGDYLVALVFSTDTMSKVLKPDSGERILFGDAATAAKMKKEEAGDKGFRINKIVKWSPAVDPRIVKIPTSIAPELLVNNEDSEEEIDAKHADVDTFKIDGQKVYDIGVDYSTRFIQNYLKKNNLTLEDFDYVIPHQANGRMLDTLQQELNFGVNRYGQQRMLSNIETVGNTASSSVPLALYDFNEAGKFKDGDRILTCSFGAGFTLGIVDFEYIN